MSPLQLVTDVITPALELLPAKMTSLAATVMVLATHFQEDPEDLPQQMGGGPAHGFWQFERGGAVVGVMTHPASHQHAVNVCAARGVRFQADDVYQALCTDNVLAAAFARLLLWTDPAALPEPVLASGDDAWELYKRTWRPGKPGPDRWPGNWRKALDAAGVNVEIPTV